jgi:uncharacterized protein YbaR (Trm112 family)
VIEPSSYKEILVCPGCKQPFRMKNPDQICCSLQCKLGYFRGDGKGLTRVVTCKHCEGEFSIPGELNTKYCSQACRNAAVIAGPPMISQCLECKQTFTQVGRYIRKYCGGECMNASLSKQRSKRKKRKRFTPKPMKKAPKDKPRKP